MILNYMSKARKDHHFQNRKRTECINISLNSQNTSQRLPNYRLTVTGFTKHCPKRGKGTVKVKEHHSILFVGTACGYTSPCSKKPYRSILFRLMSREVKPLLATSIHILPLQKKKNLQKKVNTLLEQLLSACEVVFSYQLPIQ